MAVNWSPKFLNIPSKQQTNTYCVFLLRYAFPVAESEVHYS